MAGKSAYCVHGELLSQNMFFPMVCKKPIPHRVEVFDFFSVLHRKECWMANPQIQHQDYQFFSLFAYINKLVMWFSNSLIFYLLLFKDSPCILWKLFYLLSLPLPLRGWVSWMGDPGASGCDVPMPEVRVIQLGSWVYEFLYAIVFPFRQPLVSLIFLLVQLLGALFPVGTALARASLSHLTWSGVPM